MAAAVPRETAPRRIELPLWFKHTLALTWVLVVGFAVLLPALAGGGSLGPFDLLSQAGLTARSGASLHNPETLDQVTQMIPWTKLAWTQVHAGHLPLWNPYSGLGMPLAFNWQSAAFSFPALVGYLAPLKYAFTVQLFVTLAIAGSGVYVLGRVLRLNIWACVFAATVFELSGPLVAWLGWPVASVVAWSGWLVAATLLVVRGRRRSWAIAFLAVTLAGAIYAGQVDILVVMVAMLLVFVAVLLALRTHWLRGSGPILRPGVDLVLGSVAGCALAAPLLLPGLQLVGGSVRAGQSLEFPLKSGSVVNLVFQGYNGIPVAGQQSFGRILPFYPDYSIYVGVIVVVLAVTAAVLRWRRPETKAFVVMGVAALLLTFSKTAISIVQILPDVEVGPLAPGVRRPRVRRGRTRGRGP